MSLPRWSESLTPRLKSQIEFLVAIDALKTINRACRISSNERRENSAEHSWHLTMFARVLAEHANVPVDVERVILMLMVHDIVEIDAGDVPLHGPQNPNQSTLESAAARRLFGLLPSDQAALLHHYWEEFEAAESPDAQFAKAIDRLQPILLNALTDGGTWVEFDVSASSVRERTAQIATGSDNLWTMATAIFNEAEACGWLKTDPPIDLT